MLWCQELGVVAYILRIISVFILYEMQKQFLKHKSKPRMLG